MIIFVEQFWISFEKKKEREKRLDKWIRNLRIIKTKRKKYERERERGNSETIHVKRNAVIFMRLGMQYCMLHAIYPRIKGCLIITFRLGVESSISRVRFCCVYQLGENKGQKKYHGVVEEGPRASRSAARSLASEFRVGDCIARVDRSIRLTTARSNTRKTFLQIFPAPRNSPPLPRSKINRWYVNTYLSVSFDSIRLFATRC